MKKTIGIVAVAAFSAKAEGVVEVMIAAGRRRIRSPASSGNRPSVFDRKILTFHMTGFFQAVA